ncbi:DUF4333 domain-containing protein [Pseudonocardia benzenivorans]
MARPRRGASSLRSRGSSGGSSRGRTVETPRKRRALPWILVGALVVVAAVAAVLLFWKPGFVVTRVFDQTALQAGVEKVLTTDYGHQVSAVSCPANREVKSGDTFQCSATVDGEPNTQVPIHVTSSEGNYEVGRV